MIKITTHSILGTLVIDEKDIVSIHKLSSREVQIRGEAGRVKLTFNEESSTDDFIHVLQTWRQSGEYNACQTVRPEFIIAKELPVNTEQAKPTKAVAVGDILCVTWLDAAGQNGRWEFASDLKEALKATEVRSYGLVVDTHKDYLVLCAHYGEPTGEDQEVQYQGCMAIPLCCIQKVEHLI